MDEIAAILRGADPLIGIGGRSLLSKILNGSRAKDVLSKKTLNYPGARAVIENQGAAFPSLLR